MKILITGGILWKDKEICVEWPIPEGMEEKDLVLSEKDRKWVDLRSILKEKNKDA